MKTMRSVAFITRSTLFTVPGGDTVQIVQTAEHLKALDVRVDILLSHAVIPYERYDLLHFFNIIRPADILYHCRKAQKPYVVSTIFCNYTEFDKHHRKGYNFLFNLLPADWIEYLKTMARWLLGRDKLASLDFVWKGQRKSIVEILNKAAVLLPNSESEYKRVRDTYHCNAKYQVVPNGVNLLQFQYNPAIKKDEHLVLCVARIEGNKNQMNLIRALNNTKFRLLIIGAHAPNQANYYQACLKLAAPNVKFLNRIPLEELIEHYKLAKVHVLPSWFETTGLSSVEAAVMGCNIVITDKGDTVEYFGDDAIYCDPESPESIRAAIEKASSAPFNQNLRQTILKNYTWEQAAEQTLKAYQLVATA